MFRKGFQYVLMDQAGADGTASGGAASDVAEVEDTSVITDTPAEDVVSDVAASEVAADQGGNALSKGAQQTSQIPDKYQVKKEDGSLDIEASSLKLAEAYGNLEKRIGTGDIPPKTFEEYEVTVPEDLKETWIPKDDPLLQGFLKDAHAAGFTQKQVDLAMNRYMELAPQLVNGAQQLSADDCVAELKGEWKTEAQYNAEVGKAYNAAVAYAGKDADSLIKDHGNDPRFIRLLAKVGAEMGEDKSLNNGGGPAGANGIEELVASEAYKDPKHTDHARVSKQVADHFARVAAAQEKAGNSPLM